MLKRTFLPSIMLLAFSSLLLFGVQAETAQTAPNTPEFVLKTEIGVNGAVIMLIIQNQPFNAQAFPNDGFYYNVRMRIEGGNWSELYTAEDWYPPQTNDSTTALTYKAGETAYAQQETSQGHPAIPNSGKAEFEVQAMIGHRDRGALDPGTMIMPYVFVGEKSDWSPPQKVTIGTAFSPTTISTITPAPTPGKPDSASWVIIGVVGGVVVALIVAVVFIGRRSKENERNKLAIQRSCLDYVYFLHRN
jgi:hypothetical protein